MTLHTRSWGFIDCDACGQEGPEGPSANEIRAKAYGLGWRFPPRPLKNGGKSTNRSRDICPACVATGAEVTS